MRAPGRASVLALLAVLATAGPATAQGPAWLAGDVGAPYVVLEETPDGDFEVGTLQFLVLEDRGGQLRVRVRATDETLAALFGAGDYLVQRDTGEVLAAAAQSLAAEGQRLGWWLDPAALPEGNATVRLLGTDFRLREPDDPALLALEGRIPDARVNGEPAALVMTRTYRVEDGLLLGAEVRWDHPEEGPVPLLRVDLAAAGPTQGGLPPELATFALLGPASFAAGFGAMLLARRAHHLPPPARASRFCTRCGSGIGEVPVCPRCGEPGGAA